jgi:hypothetical protein
MTMKISFKIFAFVAMLCLMACDSMVTNVTPPKVEPKLVVYAFLSPDETEIAVHVRRSLPIWSGNSSLGNDTVADAVVRLSNGFTEVLIPYDAEGIYRLPQSAFPLQAGETYLLRVSTSQGEVVTGSTRIPERQVFIDTIVYTRQPGPFGFSDDVFNVRWTDLPGGDNHYMLSVTLEQEGLDSVFSDFFGFLVFSDVFQSRDAINGRLNALVNASFFGEQGDTIRLYFNLAYTDRDYYRYHSLRLNYTGNSPFSEPTIMFENVQGGTGVVASYRNTRVVYEIVVP